MEDFQNYVTAFQNLRESISRIDRKTGMMLSVASFIVSGVSLTRNYIQPWYFLPTIVSLCLAIAMFLLSVVPIIRVGKESKENPLYVFNIKTKGDNEFLSNSPTKEHYLSQIRKFRLKLRIKYIFFYTGITLLLLSLTFFIIGLCSF